MPDTNFNPFPVLKTERLILRQLLITDDTEIFALRSDEQVNKYLNRQPSKTIEDAQAFIRAINENAIRNDSIYWAITLEGKLIGTICLFDFSNDHSNAEIGYELLPFYQRQGLMQEAILKVLEFGFEHIGLQFITAITDPENEHSTRLLEKFNFKKQLKAGDDFDKTVIVYKLSKKLI